MEVNDKMTRWDRWERTPDRWDRTPDRWDRIWYDRCDTECMRIL